MADPAVAEEPVEVAVPEGLIAVELDIDTPAPAAEVPPEESVEAVEPVVEETPAEEQPAEETPAETVIEAVDNEADVKPIDEPVADAPVENDRLARYRKDKVLDETLVSQELERAQNLAAYHQNLNAHFAKDPLGKMHFYESLDRVGNLSDEARKEMNYLRTIIVQQPNAKPAAAAVVEVKAPLTAEQAQVEARKLITAGREDEAMTLISNAAEERAKTAMRAELAPLQENLSKAEKVEASRVERVKEAESARSAHADITAGCKAFPSLMEVGDNVGDSVKFKCKTFQKGFSEMYAKMPNASVTEIARQTLISQGRLRPGKGKPATPAKPTVGTPVHAVQKARAKAPQPKMGEIAITLD